MNYEDFIAGKIPGTKTHGFDPKGWRAPKLFPFQRAMVRWALNGGRAALFAECGLGKTPMQLEWAKAVAAHSGGQVLVLAPLAVSGQTVREGVKFGVDVRYAKRKEDIASAVTITNYERLDAFDTSAFAGVVLDESSILKSFTGATKRALVEGFQRTPFRLACTATPAPNDHLEIGNHAEFLGVLTSHEMIARWFINDTSTFGTYRLKGHAVTPFWDWVSSWARCCGKPSDVGHYSDEGFVLPPMNVVKHALEVDVRTDAGATDKQARLFRQADMSATSVHAEKRRTAATRAAKVAELVAAEPHEAWLLWCETDYEADALLEAVPGAVDVRGSMTLEKKEALLTAFSAGEERILITKPKLAGFGLNWQHVARVAFVGPTFSYEQYYQAVRRAWRFGQKRDVHVHVIMAQTEVDVWSILIRKAKEHEAMKVEMFEAMRRAQRPRDEHAESYRPTVEATFPEWLKEQA